MGAVMRALDQRIKAELLGNPDELQIVKQAGAHIFAGGMLTADDQAELHLRPSWLQLFREQQIHAAPAKLGKLGGESTELAGEFHADRDHQITRLHSREPQLSLIGRLAPAPISGESSNPAPRHTKTANANAQEPRRASTRAMRDMRSADRRCRAFAPR